MINIDWLKENFEHNLTIFDIGSACIDNEPSYDFRQAFPNAKLYAFECEKYWLPSNIRHSITHGIHYFHVAIDNENSVKKFIPSITDNGNFHPWSGSFYDDISQSSKKIYGEPYDVVTVRLDTFCERFGVTPDFIHMDAEGNEYNIMSALGNIRPKAIWTEIQGFHSYKNGKNIEEFDYLMKQLGYILSYSNENDVLYSQANFRCSPYTHREIT